MSKILTKYLRTWNYDIDNPKGDSCIGLNILDSISLIGYIFIVIFITWSIGIANLTYVATAIVSFRTLIKFWIKQKEIKKNNGEISLTYNSLFVAYFVITAILIIFYVVVYYVDGGMGVTVNLSLTIYYAVFFIVEITEIIVRCFDAKPHIYGR